MGQRVEPTHTPAVALFLKGLFSRHYFRRLCLDLHSSNPVVEVHDHESSRTRIPVIFLPRLTLPKPCVGST